MFATGTLVAETVAFFVRQLAHRWEVFKFARAIHIIVTFLSVGKRADPMEGAFETGYGLNQFKQAFLAH